MGGGGRVGGGKVKGQLSRRHVATLVVRERMKKTRAVQSGHTLPMGRCASPPVSMLKSDHYASTGTSWRPTIDPIDMQTHVAKLQ